MRIDRDTPVSSTSIDTGCPGCDGNWIVKPHASQFQHLLNLNEERDSHFQLATQLYLTFSSLRYDQGSSFSR